MDRRQSKPRRDRRDRRVRRAERRPAALAVMLLILGGIASGIELIVLGRVTPVVLAFDSVGAGLLPLGILSLFVTPIDPTGRGPESSPGEDDGGGGGGGGGGRAGSRPLPPTGGLGIDWPRFEREFRAYAERVTAAPAAR